jgi:UDP-N-acetylmuramyl pentapeptide phosphotransferase/UDP-N-acetylglucosamine-1-phosphate transferase
MRAFLVAFFSSFAVTLLIIRYESLHRKFSSDCNQRGPQKFHTGVVSRIGGVSIVLGILTAIIARSLDSPFTNIEWAFFVCALPAFLIGFAEDITKKVSIKIRLLITAASALCAVYLLNCTISRMDVPGVDYLLSVPTLAVLFTIFAITGLSNAYNIIDGFNGLASMVGIITLITLAYISLKVGDNFLLFMSLIGVGAILGFFIWNYPRGLIFLGDGGAYLIGFWIATITILLVKSHAEISPWFALTVNGYPVLETVFTIYRRMIHQNKNPGQPDGMHLHSLIYRRLLKVKHFARNKMGMEANSRTAPYLWIMTFIIIIPAICWPESTWIMMSSFLLYILWYVWIYKKIVTFKIPKWVNF